MAITFPYDLLTDFPGWSTDFDLAYRQEQSRSAGGVTYVKDMGTPLWKASYQSRSMTPNELDYWRARFKLLENGLNQFYGRPKSRCYPIAYPNGSWPTGGTFNGTNAAVDVIAASRKAIRLKGLPAGYKGKTGDYLQIGTRNLHQVMEDFVADTLGNTPSFEIRSHLWPETVVNDAVSVMRPSCLMTFVPDSLTSTAEMTTGRGTISFQAIESR